MLGYNYVRKPITGEFAREIRAAAWRAATGNYNEQDLKTIRESEEIRKRHKATWMFDD